jgi:hypothetical protein
MIMNRETVKRLAIQCGDYSVEHGINGVQFTNEELQAFALAIIENYKASLVPVAITYISRSGYMEAEFKKTIEAGIELYAPPPPQNDKETI